MMMPKKVIVCFIVLLDNKNIWFGEKNKSLSQYYWESYDNFIDFIVAVLNISFLKNRLSM